MFNFSPKYTVDRRILNYNFFSSYSDFKKSWKWKNEIIFFGILRKDGAISLKDNYPELDVNGNLRTGNNLPADFNFMWSFNFRSQCFI